MEGINGFVTAWHALATKSHCHVLRLVIIFIIVLTNNVISGLPQERKRLWKKNSTRSGRSWEFYFESGKIDKLKEN